MALYVREAGPRDAPCLIFLHGLWLSSAMWQPQLERLAQDYHCLAPDLPEHGNSTDIGQLTLANTSRVVATLIREQSAHGSAHIIGLSLGRTVALALLREVPEVVDHLMVSGTAARPSRWITALSRFGMPLLQLLKPAPLIRFALRQSNIPPPYLRVLLDDVRKLKPEAVMHFADGFVHMEVPQNVQAPSLVLFGQHESWMVKRAARELSRRLPATAVMVPHVGHLWNLQAPDLFTATVRAWMTDHPLPPELVIDR